MSFYKHFLIGIFSLLLATVSLEAKLSRFSFPALCPTHFYDKSNFTFNTWIEQCDISSIHQIKQHLDLIPRVYTAECSTCKSCGGLEVDWVYERDFPVEENGESITGSDISTGEITLLHMRKSHAPFCDHCNSHQYVCKTLAWDGNYFRKWNHKYFPNFRLYLDYCAQNLECSCYWPECNESALAINNRCYELCKALAEQGYISRDYSPFWEAKFLRCRNSDGSRDYGNSYYPNAHGIAGSLCTYTFFYSQYYQLILDLASFIDRNAVYENSNIFTDPLNQVYQCLDDIREGFLLLYNDCLDMHTHPKIYYERGLLKMHGGDSNGALKDIKELVTLAQDEEYADQELLTSELYLQAGKAYVDTRQYDKAIATLSRAIKKDPTNKEAFFERASAYFESGKLDLALEDYLHSKDNTQLDRIKRKASKEFAEALLKNVAIGAAEGAKEFVPSLCNSAYGLGTAMWSTAQHPIESTTNFINACYDIQSVIIDYCKTVDWNTIENYAVEIRTYYEKFNQLSEREKGELIGHSLGKYGVDFFACSTAFKAFSAFQNLKKANTACNFEALALSNANKENLIASSLKHSSDRERFFKNVTIEADKQNKHIIGKHNFRPGNGEFTHSDPQQLLNKFAGKGKPLNNHSFCDPGYKERVDFGEVIGLYVHKDYPLIKLPTTKGMIHYSKNGAHIVPSHPNGS